MFCPSCGSDLSADDTASVLVVCSYCETSIVLDEKVARVAGKMSVLPQPASDLFVGGTGSVLNRHFEILGRVRYGYDAGYWDEWYLRFIDDDGTAWISEDEGNLTFESVSAEESLSIDYAAVSPGDSVSIGQTVFHLDEKGIAVCEGAEGQLPFIVEQDEKTPFLELSTSDAFATVEFDLEGGVRVFRGRRLSPSEIEMDYTAEEMGVAVGGLAVERAGGEAGKERLVRDTERALSLNCYACGAPLELPAEATETVACQFCEATVDLSLQPVGCASCGANLPVHGGSQAKTIVCSHCHTQLAIKQGGSTILGALVGEDRPTSPLKIGQTCNFRDGEHRLVGHVFYRQRSEGVTYVWHEYLLHNKESGYWWLELRNGHWNWSEELTDRPANIRPMSTRLKQKLHFRDRTWKVFEVSRAQTHVAWVEGELPWVAQVGDVVSFMDAVSPPFVLSAEWTENEMEWHLGEYVTRDEIAKAFKMPVGKLSGPRGGPESAVSRWPFPSRIVLGDGLLCLDLFGVDDLDLRPPGQNGGDDEADCGKLSTGIPDRSLHRDARRHRLPGQDPCTGQQQLGISGPRVD